MKFSQIEKEHLLKAWVAISFAFAVLSSSILSATFVIYFIIALFTVGIGFLLHELAHKMVAQHYRCWAEFRADDMMLGFAIISAFLFKFLFAAPGAVMIYGNVSVKKNGKISLAGPLANIVIALIFLALKYLFTAPIMLYQLFNFGFQINAFIGLFNLIPIMNFDGTKILRWSTPIYIITLIAAGLLVVLPL
jgi:Zn-dependent protease